LGGILEALLAYSVVGEELDDSEGEIGSAGFFVSLLGFLKAVIGRKPVGIRQVYLTFEVRILLSEHESLVPFVELDVESHEALDVAEHQE
jgi:adenylate cyclase class IV